MFVWQGCGKKHKPKCADDPHKDLHEDLKMDLHGDHLHEDPHGDLPREHLHWDLPRDLSRATCWTCGGLREG